MKEKDVLDAVCGEMLALMKKLGEVFIHLALFCQWVMFSRDHTDTLSLDASSSHFGKQDYNRPISRLSIQTQMVTIEDKFELAVYSLKINQLAETLGSGGCSLGKAIKRRYTNEGFPTFISSLKLTEDEITSTVETGKEDEDECKRALAGIMSSSNGANISGEKERKDLRREGITHQLILTQIDNTLFIKESGPNIILAQVYVDDIIFGSTDAGLSKEFADDDVTIREPIRSDEDSYRTK
ncbi:hypothetical protein LXL04_016961 [Taraxacum kok-saghyz]